MEIMDGVLIIICGFGTALTLIAFAIFREVSLIREEIKDGKAKQ